MISVRTNPEDDARLSTIMQHLGITSKSDAIRHAIKKTEENITQIKCKTCGVSNV